MEKIIFFIFCMSFANNVKAETLTVDMTEVQSGYECGSLQNEARLFPLGGRAHVTRMAWNLDLVSYEPSWLNEPVIIFSDTSMTGVRFSPGAKEIHSGAGHYQGDVLLSEKDLDFTLADDGILRFEFCESYKDLSTGPDAVWQNGTLTIDYERAN